MRRFSDRLSSASSATSNNKSKTIDGPSDDIVGPLEATMSAGSDGYVALVKMLGLHQTVKILEAEYRLVTGINSHSEQKTIFGDGYVSTISGSDLGRFPIALICYNEHLSSKTFSDLPSAPICCLKLLRNNPPSRGPINLQKGPALVVRWKRHPQAFVHKRENGRQAQLPIAPSLLWERS